LAAVTFFLRHPGAVVEVEVVSEREPERVWRITSRSPSCFTYRLFAVYRILKITLQLRQLQIGGGSRAAAFTAGKRPATASMNDQRAGIA
jgi:hypothetical protein